MIGWSSLAVLIGLTSPPSAELDRRVAFCDRECPFEHTTGTTQTTALCCGEKIITDTARLGHQGLLSTEANRYARALAVASDDDDALNAALLFYSSAARRAFDAGRSEDPEMRDTCEAIIREGLALRLPPSIGEHPQVLGKRKLLRRAGEMAALHLIRRVKGRTRHRSAIRSYQALRVIEAFLLIAESYERAARLSSAGGHRHRHSAAEALHDAFMLAVQIRRTDLLCPALLASALTSPKLAFDTKICLDETDDRPALRLELDQMSRIYRRDVALWSRHLRLGHPIQSAAIATAALSVGAASSALFFNSRYLALCRMTTDALRCVGDEPANATAARGASVAFAIAAPALLLTSGYLFILRARVKHNRQQRRCVPFVGGGASSAAASFTCRF